MNGKIFAILIIVGAGTGIWLHSKSKLVPLAKAAVAPDESVKKVDLKAFLWAFVILLFGLSFLNQKEGFLLVLLIVMGALTYSKYGADIVSGKGI